MSRNRCTKLGGDVSTVLYNDGRGWRGRHSLSRSRTLWSGLFKLVKSRSEKNMILNLTCNNTMRRKNVILIRLWALIYIDLQKKYLHQYQQKKSGSAFLKLWIKILVSHKAEMLCPYRSVPACRAPGGGRYLHAPGPPLSALEYAQYARWYRPCVKVCLYFALFLSLSLCFSSFHTHSPTLFSLYYLYF